MSAVYLDEQEREGLKQVNDAISALVEGDCSRCISIRATGEMAAIKDNVNRLTLSLRETTQTHTDQEWLTNSLAKFPRILQGQRDLPAVSELILSELAELFPLEHGSFYLMETAEFWPTLKLMGTCGDKKREPPARRIEIGDGFIGRCAMEKKRLVTAFSPDCAHVPHTVVLPILFEGELKAVIELVASKKFNTIHLTFLDQLSEMIGIIINTVTASMRMQDLLKRFQSLNQSLQKQQIELKETNEKLEEKAKQLTLISKYKSQFLANMSHELRTPLNSMLILARILQENAEGTLTQKQTEFAKTIYTSGSDLLALINEILDMAKIESGMMTVEISELNIADLVNYVDQSFMPIAQARGLPFDIRIAKDMPRIIYTDAKRLQQVLKNLLSNAFKFTEKGSVSLSVAPAAHGINYRNSALQAANSVHAFTVKDSGIGIALNKRSLIFEAFQQADMTTSRKYGGTGLGLTISREIAHMLGGEIWVDDAPHQGSIFTLYLPAVDTPPPLISRETAAPWPPHESTPDPTDAPNAGANPALAGKTVLIVDDDVRNIFALTALLERHDMKVLRSENGKAAIKTLGETPNIDVILMDAMMPEMDGYETMRAIRSIPRYRSLPIVALTAKVMKGDREKCLEAGASDYISKPVDVPKLLSLLQSWTHR